MDVAPGRTTARDVRNASRRRARTASPRWVEKSRLPNWTLLMIGGLLGAAAGVIGATVSDPEVGFPAWGDLTGVVAGFGLGLLASTGSATSLVVFARTRHFAFLRTAQLFLILVAPALGTVSVAFANPAR